MRYNKVNFLGNRPQPVPSLNYDGANDATIFTDAAQITDVSVGTFITIVKFDAFGATGTPNRVASKGADWFYLTSNANSIFQCVINRATTLLNIAVNTGNFPFAIILNRYYFVSVLFDTGGIAGDQKIYIGGNGSIPKEPSVYTQQSAGSGAVVTNAGTNLWLGNNPNAPTTNMMEGAIYFAGLWPFVMNYTEILQMYLALWQPKFTLFRSWDSILFTYPGLNGLGKVFDYSNYQAVGSINGTPKIDFWPQIVPVNYSLC